MLLLSKNFFRVTARTWRVCCPYFSKNLSLKGLTFKGHFIAFSLKLIAF